MDTIQVGNRKLRWGKEIIEMRDSSEAYARRDYEAVRKNLRTDGYILLRGAIPRKVALAAQQAMLRHLAKRKAFKPGTHWSEAKIRKESGKYIEGWTCDAETGGLVGDREDDSSVESWRALGNSDAVRSCYAGRTLYNLYHNLFAPDSTELQRSRSHNDTASEEHKESPVVGPLTGKELVSPHFRMFPHCTWLRMKSGGENTKEHADYYYFRHNTNIFSRNRHNSFVNGYFPPYGGANRSRKALGDKARRLGNSSQCCVVCGEGASREDKSGARSKMITCTLCEHSFHYGCTVPKTRGKPLDGEYHCRSCANRHFSFYTCWMALCDVPRQKGPLAVLPNSQTLTGYHNPLRGLLPRQYTKVEKSHKPLWRTTDVRIGDIILFNIKTVHAALGNESGEYRLSIDTRLTVSLRPYPKGQCSPECLISQKAAESKLKKTKKQGAAIDPVVPVEPPRTHCVTDQLGMHVKHQVFQAGLPNVIGALGKVWAPPGLCSNSVPGKVGGAAAVKTVKLEGDGGEVNVKKRVRE